MCPSTHNVESPNVSLEEFQLLDCDVDAGIVSVLLENGDTKDDLILPGHENEDKTPSQAEADEELGKQISDAVNEDKPILVTVLSAMGKKKIVRFKEISS